MNKNEGDETYQHDHESPARETAALLINYQHLLTGGKALDVGMGMGHNAVFLASRGYQVDGVDISPAAVSKVREYVQDNGLSVCAIEADLSSYKIGEATFDAIINFYYLDRNLIPAIKNGLKQGGIIFFETYTEEQRQFGRPRNPDYLLKPNELLFLFSDFFIIFYHERIEKSSKETKAIASLIAQKV